jgi:hypothetical protein
MLVLSLQTVLKIEIITPINYIKAVLKTVIFPYVKEL